MVVVVSARWVVVARGVADPCSSHKDQTTSAVVSRVFCNAHTSPHPHFCAQRTPEHSAPLSAPPRHLGRPLSDRGHPQPLSWAVRALWRLRVLWKDGCGGDASRSGWRRGVGDALGGGRLRVQRGVLTRFVVCHSSATLAITGTANGHTSSTQY